MEDGRYLIFYTFDREAARAEDDGGRSGRHLSHRADPASASDPPRLAVEDRDDACADDEADVEERRV